MSNTELEIWKDIVGFEGLYQCSNLGRIKSLGNGGSNNSKEKILKQQKHRDNYLIVGLSKEAKQKLYLVHRLVASTFLPNPENKPEIDHIDTNRQNNMVSNLRWVTKIENCNNPITKINNSKAKSIARKGKKLSQETKDKISIARKGKPNLALKGRKQSQEHIEKCAKARQKSIVQLTKNGEFIKQWESAIQAGKELNINASNITQCCRGKQKSAKGYKWKYLQDYINEQIQYLNELKRYRERLLKLVG